MSKSITKDAKQSALNSSVAETAFDDSDNLAIDPALKREIDGKGLVHRWINSNTLKSNYGFDPRRWSPYKREGKASSGSESFGYTDTEGFIRRGDLILAVQSKEIATVRKNKVENRTKQLQTAVNGQAASAELRRTFREAGVQGAKVFDGYDENE